MRSNILFSSLSSISSFLFQLVLLSSISQNFNQVEFGYISILAAVNSFILLCSDFGINNYLITREDVSKSMCRVLTCLIFLITLMISVPCIAYVYVISNHDSYLYGILLTCLNAIVLSFSKVNKAILQRKQRFKNISLVESLPRIFILIGFLIVVYTYGFGEVEVSVAYFTPLIFLNLITTVLYIFLGREHLLEHSEGIFSLNKEFFNFVSPLFANSILNFLTQNLDLFIVAKFMGLVQAGTYTILKQLVLRPVQVISPAITNVMISKLSSQHRQGKIISNIYANGVSYIVFPVFLTFIVIFSFSHEIIVNIFGEEWVTVDDVSTISSVLPIFMLYGLIRSSLMPVGSILSVVNRNDLALKYTIFQLLTLSPIVLYVSLEYDLLTLIYCLLIYNIIISILHWKLLVLPFIEMSYFKFHKMLFICFIVLSIIALG